MKFEWGWVRIVMYDNASLNALDMDTDCLVFFILSFIWNTMKDYFWMHVRNKWAFFSTSLLNSAQSVRIIKIILIIYIIFWLTPTVTRLAYFSWFVCVCVFRWAWLLGDYSMCCISFCTDFEALNWYFILFSRFFRYPTKLCLLLALQYTNCISHQTPLIKKANDS